LPPNAEAFKPARMFAALANPHRFMAFSRWAAPILGVNGKLDDQAPVDDIYLLMEHGSPKAARVYADGHHMGRTPGQPSDHITTTIVEWLRGQLGGA